VTKTSDLLGRVLLGWYVIETLRYFGTGRFRVEVEQLPRTFEGPATLWMVLAPLQIAVAAVGVFVLIPLLWRGTWAGLVMGLLYWAWGYATNPLWLVIPSSRLASSSKGPTVLLSLVSVAWIATSLMILVAFFLARRSIMRKQPNDDHSLPSTERSGR